MGARARFGSGDYGANYASRDRAVAYLRKYRAQPSKRLTSWREHRILRRLLARAAALAGPVDTLLDMPCGPGRLLAAYGALPRRLVLADASRSMVGLALQSAPAFGQARFGVVLDALRLPFRDRAFDGVVSLRLAHHLEGAETFERYLAELLRVSRGAVILTFFSSGSLKNRVRGIQVALGRRSPKKSVSPDFVRAVALRHGFAWAGGEPLSRLASGHLYALLVREGADAGALSRRLEGSFVRGDPARSWVRRVRLLPGRSYGAFLKRYPPRPEGKVGRGGLARAAGEWERLLSLRAEGAPVVRPLFFWRSGDGSGWLLTEELAGAVSLKALAARATNPRGAEQVAIASEAAVMELAALHERGWILGDTFAKNVLVRFPEPAVLATRPVLALVDQPRSRRALGRGPAVLAAQVKDLARLYKGVRQTVSRTAWGAALRSYLEFRRLEATEEARARFAGRVERSASRLANETPWSAFVDAAKRRVRRGLRRLF